MKKIKLLAPLLTAATLGSSAIMLTSCNNTKCQIALFVNEGGTLEGGSTSIEVTSGTKWGDIKNKPTPTKKDGYEFIGWYRNETKIEDDTVISSSMDIYAWFEKVKPSQCYVTVIAAPGGKINTSDTSTLLQVQAGDRWGNVKPTFTADANYKFVGWYMNDKLINDDTIIDSNSYIFAWFEGDANPNLIKYKFECLSGGTFNTGAQVEFEKDKTTGTSESGQLLWKDIKETVPTYKLLDGYKFVGWYLNKSETPLEDETPITETCYIFAYFEKATVTISFEADEQGKSTLEQSEITDQSVGRLNSLRSVFDKNVKPAKGYILNGWEAYDESTSTWNRIDDNYQIATNKKLRPIIVEEYNNYSNWNADKSTVTIDSRKTNAIPENLSIPNYVWKYEDDGSSKQYKVTSIAYKDGTGYCMGMSSIKTLAIPESITSAIPDRCFRECGNITTVYMPATVTGFRYHAFYRTYALSSFYFLGSIAQYKGLKNGSWWCEGMKTKSAICLDGTTNLE